MDRKRTVRSKKPIGIGRRLTVLPNGAIELVGYKEPLLVRSVDASSFELVGPSIIELSTGSFLFHLSKRNGNISLKSPLTEPMNELILRI